MGPGEVLMVTPREDIEGAFAFLLHMSTLAHGPAPSAEASGSRDVSTVMERPTAGIKRPAAAPAVEDDAEDKHDMATWKSKKTVLRHPAVTWCHRR